jgi:hypothetical protein
MASLYEINLKREILREKSAEILADYDKYLDENNISYESLNPIRVLEKIISEIYRNIFKPEYENIEKLNEANTKLDLALEVLKKLS